MTPENQDAEFYRLVFDEVAVGLAQVEIATGRFTRVNRRFCEITGYSREELLRIDFLSLTHPEDREVGQANLQLLRERRIRDFTMEKRYIRKDGSTVWVRLTVSSVAREDLQVTHHVAVVVDITRQKQEQDLLRESEIRYHQLVEEISDGVFITDTKGTLVFANPALVRMQGFQDPAQLLGRRFQEFLQPEILAEVEATFPVIIGGQALPAPINVPILRPDGSRAVFEIRAAPRWVDGRIAGAQGTIRDVTERWRAEAAVEETLRMKTEFMNNITHELRTPLNVVIGFAEMLKNGAAGPLNPRQTAYASDILASGERLLALVNGILEMARLDAPGAAPVLEPVAIRAALTERLAARAQAAEARHVRIALEPDADPGSVLLDPKALKQIIDALLDNAIKFNHEGGNVSVRARREQDWLEIVFADTGIGIAPVDLPRLFKPMAQIDTGLARSYGGIGMGLALARRQAELWGGGITVASEPGQGSTFTLSLPILLTEGEE